jgi:2-amino-4-hydroxy-6-hydroxymethyldihydropteridine diphosphokinase
MNHIVYLALGTNLGDRRANLQAAMDSFAPEIKILSESKVYETAPWGYADQPPFLNMAVKAETDLEALALLAHLKQLEAKLGREKTFRWGPRLIDMDILFYDDLVFQSESLTIPHPHLHERAFVIVPLADIAPDFVHPVSKRTVRELLADVNAKDIRPYG